VHQPDAGHQIRRTHAEVVEYFGKPQADEPQNHVEDDDGREVDEQ
jgi:hypothetical protein